jgi:polysaccharide deacetylase 2 family uncharacterized protein YibQ
VAFSRFNVVGLIRILWREVLARKNRVVNRHKQGKGKNPLLVLALIVILIVTAFYLLERVKESLPIKPVESPMPVDLMKIPPRITSPQGQQRYSAATILPHHPKVKLPGMPTGPGSLAIIVDDMGSSMQEVRALLAINLPITFSVIPGLARASGVATTAHNAGREVMAHMPMEPQGYPQQRLEKKGLLVSLSAGEIEERVISYLQEIPFAVGANNHMGSRFTEDETKMQPVLKVLKERDLFFIDSKTSPASVGYRLARSMGLRAGVRLVFLDNVQRVDAIKAQLEQAAAIARKKGSAIAICHPHQTTIRALTEMMPELEKAGITFVYASQLVS